MVNKPDKNVSRLRRHRRVRGKISGTAACPRLDVFRSSKHIYAQLIDDVAGVTLASASSMDKDFEGFGGNIEAFLFKASDGRLHLAFAYQNRRGVKWMTFSEQDVMGEKRETVGVYNPTAARV